MLRKMCRDPAGFVGIALGFVVWYVWYVGLP